MKQNIVKNKKKIRVIFSFSELDKKLNFLNKLNEFYFRTKKSPSNFYVN